MPAGTVSADVVLAGTDTVAIGPADLDLAEGSNTIVYAWGSEDAGFQLAVQTISGAHSAPSGVPGGSAGLVDDAMPGAVRSALGGRSRRSRPPAPCGWPAPAADPAVAKEIPVRPAAVGAVLGLALAIGAPTAWSLTRPSASAGAPVEQVLGGGREPDAGPSSAALAAPTVPRPAVPTRDAAPAPAVDAPAPVRLQVPALGVDTAVDPVGVEDDGQMSIPVDVDRVGWYRFGPVPGVDGSAVIAGHVDDREQGLGVMAPLRGAEVGTEVAVTDAAGTTTRWRVVARELISKQVLPLDRLFTRTGPPHLVLITCGGPFLPEFRSYRDNVVVIAEPLR